jgi:hypothetical protein
MMGHGTSMGLIGVFIGSQTLQQIEEFEKR